MRGSGVPASRERKLPARVWLLPARCPCLVTVGAAVRALRGVNSSRAVQFRGCARGLEARAPERPAQRGRSLASPGGRPERIDFPPAAGPAPSHRQAVNPVRPGREQRQRPARVPGCGWSVPPSLAPSVRGLSPPRLRTGRSAHPHPPRPHRASRSVPDQVPARYRGHGAAGHPAPAVRRPPDRRARACRARRLAPPRARPASRPSSTARIRRPPGPARRCSGRRGPSPDRNR